MPVLSYAAYTFAVLGFVLAGVGISRNPRSWINRLFSLGMLSIGVWAFSMAIIYQADPESDTEVLMQIMRASANLLNPLAAGFILGISRSRGFRSPALQLAMWGSCLARIAVDLSGNHYGRGLIATPWGNAFLIDAPSPAYYSQLALMFFHFIISMVAVIQGIDRSVSRHYRRQLLVIAILSPFLMTGMVLIQFILPLILNQPFPSLGLFFWGAVQIVLFISMLRMNLLENEAEIILKGVRYSRTRPVVSINSGLQITGMNEPARRLLSSGDTGAEKLMLSDIVRNNETLSQITRELAAESHAHLTVTLSDGLTSVTILHDSGISTEDLSFMAAGKTVNDTPGPEHEESTARAGSRDEKVASIAREFDLSPREQDVLSLLLQGLSSGEISTQLFVSLSTIKTHISNIYRKVGISSRPALLARVLQSEE